MVVFHVVVVLLLLKRAGGERRFFVNRTLELLTDSYPKLRGANVWGVARHAV
jgi:hypothetical protein